ncbi:MAG: sugar phosphate isomerase/epimerase [Planctomycetota bacterium]|nr:sugar phosphate isomerase/epimerase [Planctomycetota bacterium]
MTNPRIGVCSWSLRPSDSRQMIAALRRLDIAAVQLALGTARTEPSIDSGVVDRLRSVGFRIVSGMMGMAAEDYSTLESIRRTGGVRPDKTWPSNRRHAAAVARFAGQQAIGLVTFHAGFLPQRRDDPERSAMLERLRRIADLFGEHGVDVALETGQETAETLADVLAELDRPNVGVNFDPANVILYDAGDPIQALCRLAPFVRQVHVKDALPADSPGTWGTEVAMGRGAVDWDAFFAQALAICPAVNFVIERESGANRDADVASARDLVARYLSAQ